MTSRARALRFRMASAVIVAVVASPLAAQQTSVPRPGVVITSAPPPAPGAAAIPPLSPDARRLVDQWKLDHASIIEQLRALQLADDSSIAAAAIHAGLLKPGEMGMIRVTTAAGQAAYVAAEQNGIKSQAYGPFEGSFRLERVK